MTRAIICSAFLFLMCVGAPAAAQEIAVDGLLGGRTFSDGTGMIVAELRVGVAPSTWVVRPTVGLAGASDTLGTQRELMLGVHGDIQAAQSLAFSIGGGVAHLSQDGGTWNSGNSTGGYLQASALLRRSRDSRVMFAADVRRLMAPAFTRRDGLKQEVSFTQISVGLTFRMTR